MKKLMIAAAIVCAAALSQAASLQWGGAIADPKYATSLSYSDYQAYPATAMLLWSSEAFTAAATQIDGITKGSLSDNGGKVVKTFDIGATQAASAWTFTDVYEVSGGSVDGYYAVLVTNGDGTKASYYDIGQVSGTGPTSSPVDKRVNMGWSPTTDFLEKGGYTVTVGAVPEPTSGLLLLLGVAGLALRRRRA